MKKQPKKTLYLIPLCLFLASISLFVFSFTTSVNKSEEEVIPVEGQEFTLKNGIAEMELQNGLYFELWAICENGNLIENQEEIHISIIGKKVESSLLYAIVQPSKRDENLLLENNEWIKLANVQIYKSGIYEISLNRAGKPLDGTFFLGKVPLTTKTENIIGITSLLALLLLFASLISLIVIAIKRGIYKKRFVSITERYN